MGSSGEGVGPIGGGHGHLEEESANNVVGGAQDALSLSILRRSVGTRHAKGDAVSKKERAGGGIVEFAPIVALDRFDWTPELSANIGKEMRKCRECFRLETKGNVHKK